MLFRLGNIAVSPIANRHRKCATVRVLSKKNAAVRKNVVRQASVPAIQLRGFYSKLNTNVGPVGARIYTILKTAIRWTIERATQTRRHFKVSKKTF